MSIVFLGLALTIASGACQPAPPSPAPLATATSADAVTLHFTYWGTEVEKEAVAQTVRAFEAAHPNIHVEAQHIPNAEYIATVSGMFASDTPPDIGYLFETHAALWASGGRVLDLTDLVMTDPELSSRLPETYYYYAPGKTIGTSTAAETVVMFYNRDLFDQAGLAYPPAEPEAAWTWDEFVAAAKRLTTDVNGLHPDDPGFDVNQIKTYGVSFAKWWAGYYPFIYSNGGEIVNSDGTRLLLDSTEAVQAMQRLADLMWVYHVAPTPSQDLRLPAVEALMQTGQAAMVIDGQWKLLDYSSTPGLNYGIAVLPNMKTPKTLILGSPTVVFAGTPHLEAAIEFYKFHNDPKVVDLFARGLWMPLQKSYYTEPEAMAAWLDNPAHPPEARGALVDYTLCCVVPTPHYYVRNFGQIADTAIQPAVDVLWNNEATAAAAMAQAVRTAAPLMAGRWDQ
jgi:multiple sugar transport system substrate-binding protein